MKSEQEGTQRNCAVYPKKVACWAAEPTPTQEQLGTLGHARILRVAGYQAFTTFCPRTGSKATVGSFSLGAFTKCANCLRSSGFSTTSFHSQW